jgi:acyl-CoA synthetase (NDP forming)
VTATTTGLDRLFAPRSIALVGASGDPRKFGGRPLAALRRHGFEGDLFVVNPRHTEVQGAPSVPSAADLPMGLDLAVLLVPAEEVVPAMRALVEREIGAAVVMAGGFRETGADGEERQDELAALAARAGIRVLGPNCPGFVNLRHRVACSSSAFATREEMWDGPIAFVVESGAVAGIVADRAFDRGIGVGTAICTGNQADVTTGDAIRYLTHDGGTRAIGLFLERVTPDLVDALRDARAAGVGVAALKVGRSETGRAVVAVHTAGLVGSDRTFDAICASLGVVRVDDYDELLETAWLLATVPEPGRRLAVVGASGGMNTILADAADAEGLQLPELAAATVERIRNIVPSFGSAANPVDISSVLVTDPGSLGAALSTLADDPGVDGLLVTIGDHPPALSEMLADSLIAAVAAAQHPVTVQWSAGALSAAGIWRLNRAGVPVLESPVRAVRAIARAMAAATARAVAATEPLAIDVPLPASESQAKEALERAGVVTPRRLVCADPEGVSQALGTMDLGASVVVKADCVGAAHKTESGAVRVGIAREDAARVAREVWESARARIGEDRVRGVIVEEMVRPVAELLVSAVRDPTGVTVVVVGAGGELVEVLAETACRIAPLSEEDALAMLDGLRVARLLDGVRGRPAGDRRAVARAIVAIARLALADQVALIEVNPLAATPDGAVALDAVIERASAS